MALRACSVFAIDIAMHLFFIFIFMGSLRMSASYLPFLAFAFCVIACFSSLFDLFFVFLLGFYALVGAL